MPESQIYTPRPGPSWKPRLPQFVLEMLAAPPRHGEGVHGWLFRTARCLHPFLGEDEIAGLLATAVRDCGRVVPRNEIMDAVRNSKDCAWQPRGSAGAFRWASPQTRAKVIPNVGPPWPEPDRERIAKIVAATKVGGYDLWEASPVRIDSDEYDSDWYLDRLFPGNPFLCCGLSARKFRTHPREWFRNRLSPYSLIVPSAMSALKGRAKQGHLSAHTLDNTGPRQHLVTESDVLDKDQQAAVIWHLRKYAPLRLVLDSGCDSLHAWWDCRGFDDRIVGRFFRYAITLGADKRMWLRSQFARLPEGWRSETKRRQQVIYFDPETGNGGQP